MNSSLSFALLGIWQIVFLVGVFRRHVRVGLAVLGYSAAWCLLLLWAGALQPATAAFLVVVEVAPILIVYRWAPGLPRAAAFVLAGIGTLLVVDAWLGTNWAHWRIVVAVTVAAGVLISGVWLVMTDRGHFRIQPDPAGFLATARPDAPFRYSYWSQRAIDSVVDPQPTRSRPQLKAAKFGMTGAEVTLEQIPTSKGRHAVATSLEEMLKNSIHKNAEMVAASSGDLLSGSGTIHVTAYGSGEADSRPGGRVALFARQAGANGERVAICLFGSMENFDASIGDMHPVATRGVAHSAALDVIAWIHGSAWDRKRWGESVGTAAYKIATPEKVNPSQDMPALSKNYERVAVLKQDHTEWLALIYHVEEYAEPTDAPFERILVGRPIWVRSQLQAITAAQDTSQLEVNEQCRGYWKRTLDLDSDSKGWPVYMYRLLLARQGIASDL